MKEAGKLRGWKKWLKIAVCTVFSIFLIVILAIGALVNFVFTPEKLTPELVKIVNENIEGKFYCESAEFTFFSSFPNFGVEIKKGKLTNKQDTLLLLNSCNAEFNVRKLLLNKIIDIKNIALRQASVNVLIDKNGKLNWDILKTKNIEDKKVENPESDFKINELYIKKLNLNRIQVKYANQVTNDLLSIDSLSTNFKMSYEKEKIACTLNADIKKIKFVKEGFKLLQNSKGGINTELTFLRKEHKLLFTKGGININGVDLLVNGFIKRDMVGKKFATDLTLRLKVPDLKSVLDLIPEKIVQKEKINVKGEVTFLATIKGFYGKNVYPLTQLHASIKNGEFQYVDYPGSINHIATDVKLRLDFKDKKSSHLTISNLDLKGFGINLQGNLAVENLMVNPFLKTILKGNVDITKLNKVIPFSPDVTAQGNINIDMQTSFNINDIKEQDISSLQIKGKALVNNLTITIRKDSLSLKVKQLDFNSALKSEQVLSGFIGIKAMELKKSANHYVKADQLKMNFSIDRTLADKSVLKADVQTGTITFQAGLNKKAELKGGKIAVNVQGNRTDKSKASISSNFKLDSLGIYVDKHFAGIKGGKYTVKLQRNSQKKWIPYGIVQFEQMMAYAPGLGMPIKIENTTLTLKEKLLELRNAKLTFGKSDVTLTGSIDNVKGLLSDKYKDEKVTARLSLYSKFIDTNQLMTAFNQASQKVVKDEKEPIASSPAEILNAPVPQTSEEKKIIQIPKNIDFVFDSHINKLKFGTMDIDDIRGNIIVKEGKVKLSNAKMKTLAAELSTNVSYTYLNEKEANVNLDFNLNKVEMSRLAEMLPVLDSLFPVIKSFEGLVDFRIKGLAKVDKNMEMKSETIKGVAGLQATNIMAFDSETFRELAKTFMFKSKEKNPIESLHAEMIISDSKLELLPSLIAIDRYEFAIGGIQNLDLSYNYHISVLKSPIPFKTGVDVKGSNFDDFKIKLSKAKYKFYFTDYERLQKKSDSTVIKKKAAILKLLDFKE
ncbi:hypothetical protein ACRASX_12525 [Flavobacterium sp. TMP13]|uniref:hypothetical protein n=1 Tax=Flavobacterium sp. TMP13 TaxID=3425950 RepID=UPI003D788972